jgi:hypothetical protein
VAAKQDVALRLLLNCTHDIPQVDVDYSDADKSTVLRFFAALAELVSRQPPARLTSGIDGVSAQRQVTGSIAAVTDA